MTLGDLITDAYQRLLGARERGDDVEAAVVEDRLNAMLERVPRPARF